MVKKTRVFFALLLTAALLATTGCGGGNASSTATGGSESTPAGVGGFDFNMEGDATGTGSTGTTGNTTGTGSTGTTGNTTGTGSTGGSGNTTSNTTGTGSTGGSGGTVSVEIPAADKPVTMTIASLYGDVINKSAAGTNVYADIIKEKIKDIRKKYNVIVKYKVLSGDLSNLATSIRSGSCNYSLIEVDLGTTRNLALQGLLLPQNDYVNLNASQFQKAKPFNDTQTYNGKTYGTTFSSTIDNYFCIYVNQTLVNQCAGTKKADYDILKLYKDGKWTMDKFREVAKMCTKKDGSGRVTTWGAVEGAGNGLFLSAYTGGTVIYDGKNYVPAMLNEAGVKCYEFLKQMIFTDGTFKTTDDGLELFKKGQCAMLPQSLGYHATLLPEVEDDVVVVPIPKAEGYQNNHILGIYGGHYFSIPKSADNPALVGKVYEELSTADLDNGCYLKMMQQSGLETSNIKMIIEDFPKYGHAEFVGCVDVTKFNSTLVKAYTDPNGSTQQLFDSVRGQFEAAIEDTYGKVSNLK